MGNKDVKESEERMALTQEGLGADLLATPASLIHCIRKKFQHLTVILATADQLVGGGELNNCQTP